MFTNNFTENTLKNDPLHQNINIMLIEDVEYDHTQKDFNLHQALGQEQTLVKITRHVDR